MSWPPSLANLHLSGLGDNGTLAYFYSLPKSLTSFTIHDSPKLGGGPLKALVTSLGQSIENLHIGTDTLDLGNEPVENLLELESLYEWLQVLPKLRRLHICFRWIVFEKSMVSPDSFPTYNAQHPHPLEYLELDFRHISAYTASADMSELYDAFYDAIAEGYLARLRRVVFFHRIDTRLGKTEKQLMHEMDELLRALAREDGENATIKEEHAGVKVVYVKYHVKQLIEPAYTGVFRTETGISTGFILG